MDVTCMVVVSSCRRTLTDLHDLCLVRGQGGDPRHFSRKVNTFETSLPFQWRTWLSYVQLSKSKNNPSNERVEMQKTFQLSSISREESDKTFHGIDWWGRKNSWGTYFKTTNWMDKIIKTIKTYFDRFALLVPVQRAGRKSKTFSKVSTYLRGFITLQLK